MPATRLKPAHLTPPERARLQAVEGIVFDIQRYSLHDGPGLRTNVFMKGCPLRCGWCANPESQQPLPELGLTAGNCITCGQFDLPCPSCWGSQKRTDRTRALRDELGTRTAVCPTGAIHWLGERHTAGEIIAEVQRDAPFYEAGGGLTLTGGEPTMQPVLAEALLRLAKAEGISTAMESCGHTPWAVLERLIPYLDHILYDLKHIDQATHQTYTGLGNELILSNLSQLAALGVPLIIRVPLIPGFNSSVEAIQAIAEFVGTLEGLPRRVDLLPYHAL
ncbi:MAG: glycyl-radical enzyme activating protein, partial [Anaerolineae bacterium]|nr:glycyl-radical enzyme activating protein [Anaerolineae bacterium]